MNVKDVCRNLRTKKMYIGAEPHEAFAAENNDGCGCGHCWCNRTMVEVGPDDRQVGAGICVAGRSCFEQ